MSTVATPRRPSAQEIFAPQSYIWSDPRDPGWPSVEEPLRTVVLNWQNALRDFYKLSLGIVVDYHVMLLSRYVRVPKPIDLSQYLSRHPGIEIVAVSVCQKAATRLQWRGQLSLEVYHDPEVEDEYLILYLRQHKYDPHILDIIESLNRETETEKIRTSGWLLVTTDFQPPQ